MIRRSVALGAAGLSLALAGCGGGGSSTATPTPTPTTTVTPTPTVSPTYTSFPLTAAAEFGTIDAFTSYTGNFTTGPVTLGAAGTEVGSTRFRAALQPTPTAASTTNPVVVHENTEETRYTATDLVTPPTPTATEYVFTQNDTTVAGKTATSEFLNNTTGPASGTGVVSTTDTVLKLAQTSYADYIRSDATAGPGRVTYGVFGYPTVAGDLPTTGTSTYTTKISGRLLRAMTTGAGRNEKLSGTATITMNWATGLVTTTLNVSVTVGGVTSAYGTFSGTGAIASGATQFTGSFGASSPVSGTFAGTFFGSQGAEIGISFAGTGSTTDAGNTYDTRMLGVVVGKKN